MRILGDERKDTFSAAILRKTQVFWRLEYLENAFRFFIDAPDGPQFFVEHDELTATGKAYQNREPWHMLKIFDALEELFPGFDGVRIDDETTLVRQRVNRANGATLEKKGKTINFFKDDSLKTINFIDFYHEFLSGNKKESDESLNQKNPAACLEFRLARTGDS